MRVWVAVVLSALAVPCLGDMLQLSTGETLIGKVLSEEPGTVVFDSDSLGKVTVPRDRITRLEKTPTAPTPEETGAPLAKPPEQTAQAAADAAPEKKKDLFRMWWDQYLLYQFYQPITVNNPFKGGQEIIGEEISISGRLGFKLSLDAAGYYSTNRDPDIPGGADVRTFRLYTDGHFGQGPDPTLYSLEFGTVGGSFYMTSGWLRWQGIAYVQNIQAGYETVPQTLENIYSFASLTFMEASSMSLAFSPGNRLGVETDRTYENGRIYSSVGLYSIGSDPGLDGGTVTQTFLYPVIRVTGLPIYQDNGKDNVRLLHLGISMGEQFATGGQFQFRSRPESFIAPYLVDTGSIDADRAGLVGLEAIYMSGPLTLTAEAAATRLTGAEQEATNYWGWYASAGYFLSGEQRGYNKQKAAIASVLVPNREFSFKHPTWGAWEVAARFSQVDLNSGFVNGGQMDITMLGLNWYWNRYMRWMFNTGYANVHGGASPGNLYIFQARLQMVF